MARKKQSLTPEEKLARAFRGQLGTQDPSDPDARDLLTSDQ